MRKVWKVSFPKMRTDRMELEQGDIIPKPTLSDIPILGTGYSGQTIEWLAEHTDGWLFYSQGVNDQRKLVNKWREITGEFKPFTQALAIDLSRNPNEAPKPIQGGFRSGYRFIIDYFRACK